MKINEKMMILENEDGIYAVLMPGDNLKKRVKTALAQHYDADVENIKITEGKMPVEADVLFTLLADELDKTERWAVLIQVYPY